MQAASNTARWRSISRGLCLIAAATIVGGLFAYPRILGPSVGAAEHSALPLMLMGCCAAIVYGVGFRPESSLVRLLLGPAAAGLLIAFGVAVLALQHLR